MEELVQLLNQRNDLDIRIRHKAIDECLHLSNRRKAAGVQQKAIANKLGVSQSAISNLEAGNLRCISIEKLVLALSIYKELKECSKK